MRGRIDAAGRFVVYQTFIGPPPRTYMLKKFDAFALILEHCAYTTVVPANPKLRASLAGRFSFLA